MAGPAEPRQLALPLPHSENLTRDNFLEGPANAAALQLVDRWPDWPNQIMLLIGAEGSGKSHLASIWADVSGARALGAATLTVAAVPAALATGALVVDGFGPAVDEAAMFHLLNMARERSAFVLLTARHEPTSLDLKLPDLRSRLRALPTVALLPPDDQLLRALIVKLCADRQIAIDDGLVTFLVTRIGRSFADIRRTISMLDEEALRRGRPVTRALASELLRRTDIGDAD